MEFPENRERTAHGDDGKRGRGERGGQDEEKFSEDNVEAREWARENRLHRAALLLAGRQVNGGVHGSRHAQKDHHVADEAAEGRATHLSRRSDAVLLDLERLDEGASPVLRPAAVAT